MNITNEPFVQVRFTVVDGDDRFTDALFFTPADYAALKPADLQAQQLQRFNAWKAALIAPAPIPSPQDLQELADALLIEKARVDAAIARLPPDVVSTEKQRLGIASVVGEVILG